MALRTIEDIHNDVYQVVVKSTTLGQATLLKVAFFLYNINIEHVLIGGL